MKYKLILLTLFCIAFASNAQNTDSKIQIDIVKLINPERMIYDIRDFASPAFEGRELGTLGNIKASDWIKYQFRDIGVTPFDAFKNFEQTFDVQNFQIGKSNSLTVGSLQLKPPQISPAIWGSATQIKGEISTNLEKVAGKIALVSIDSSNSFSAQTFEQLYNQSVDLQSMGAIGIIFYWSTNYSDGVNLYRFDDYVEIPLLAEKNITNSSRPYINLKSIPIPILFTNKDVGVQLSKISGLTINYKTDFTVEFTKTASNIIGYIHGKLDRLDKALILYANLDQEGVNSTNGTPYLGANSNGSGIITLLELARVIKQMKTEPLYPIVFLAVNGSKRLDSGLNHLLKNDFISSNFVSNIWIEIKSTAYNYTEEDLTHVIIDVHSPVSFYKQLPYSVTKRPKIEPQIDTLTTTYFRSQIKHHFTLTSDPSPYTNRVIDAQNKMNFISLYRVAEIATDLVWRLSNYEQ